MKILVTGATGFTGSHLTRRLLARGDEVVGLDNQKGMFYSDLKELGAELHIGSVTDRELVNRLTSGCRQVYHLAASFRKVNLAKDIYWDVNVNGVRHVLEASRANGVERVLYCSTCGVHGNVERPPANEQSPISPADWYQQTKWEGERVCREFIESGMWITIIRPTAIFGPGDPERFAMLYRRAAKGRFLMVGDGSTHYHPVYIDNLIDGMFQAMDSDATRGKVYLIANQSSIAIKQLVIEIGKSLDKDVRFIHVPYLPVLAAAWLCEMIFKCLPYEPPLFRRRIDWFIQNRSFDISAAKRDFNYEPRISLQEGLEHTARWYRENGYL